MNQYFVSVAKNRFSHSLGHKQTLMAVVSYVLGGSHRRLACPVVAPWVRELIRPPHWWLDTFRGSCLSGRTAPQFKRRSYGQEE